MKSLFVAILEDNSVFHGGNYQHTRWLELPKDKKIKRLFYTLPDGNHLCLDMYNKYFMMQEVTTDLNGNNAGKVNLEYSYILAEKDNQIICYKINLKTGNIERNNYTINDSFVQGLSKEIWR